MIFSLPRNTQYLHFTAICIDGREISMATYIKTKIRVQAQVRLQGIKLYRAFPGWFFFFQNKKTGKGKAPKRLISKCCLKKIRTK